jgi:hypothetical protein
MLSDLGDPQHRSLGLGGWLGGDLALLGTALQFRRQVVEFITLLNFGKRSGECVRRFGGSPLV